MAFKYIIPLCLKTSIAFFKLSIPPVRSMILSFFRVFVGRCSYASNYLDRSFLHYCHDVFFFNKQIKYLAGRAFFRRIHNNKSFQSIFSSNVHHYFSDFPQKNFQKIYNFSKGNIFLAKFQTQFVDKFFFVNINSFLHHLIASIIVRCWDNCLLFSKISTKVNFTYIIFFIRKSKTTKTTTVHAL